MRRFCELFAKQFYRWNIINEEDINPLRFAFELIITQLITFVSIVILGLYFCCIYETIFYMIIFVILRKIIQGYHAKTFLLCYIFTVFNYLVVIVLCKYMSYISLFNLGSLILLYLIYKDSRKLEIKKIASITVVCYIVLIVLYLLNMYTLIDIVSLSYFFVLLMRWVGGDTDEHSSS